MRISDGNLKFVSSLKKLRDNIYNIWRRQFGSFILLDERETARKNPYTYYLPSQDRLDAIEPGDSVKLVIRSIPAGLVYDAERMWVTVKKASGQDISGTLSNIPYDIPQLALGDEIQFKRWHIIDYEWVNPEKEKRFSATKSKQIWDRCLVDEEVVNGEARVGFLYKEEPDLGQEGDKYPDSGWRIRAEVSDLTDDQYENAQPVYIAIGKVLNKDDSWIHLIDSEIGSRFQRNLETDEFEPTD